MLKQVEQLEKDVKDYYGKELQGSQDLKTDACCTVTDIPVHIKAALKNIHDEVAARYYGCGLTIPASIEGLRVLDLGSGSGRDCYLLSQLVGEQGSVLGIDMTDEQLAVAQRHIDWHRDRFGYQQANVSFVKGNIQYLASAGVRSNGFDLIQSH